MDGWMNRMLKKERRKERRRVKGREGRRDVYIIHLHNYSTTYLSLFLHSTAQHSSKWNETKARKGPRILPS